MTQHKHGSARNVPAVILLISLVWIAGACISPFPPGTPRTRAESSDFFETTRYDEVVRFLGLLQAHSDLLRIETFGKSAEGRPLPLAVLGTPPPKGPGSIDRDQKTVVFINANIHAGEVAGKEACLMLLREITQGSLDHLLADTVLLVAPIYNADGNERIDPRNRARQKGPEHGVGIRANAQSLDLNRDMIKLETPEAQSLVQNVLDRWNPDLVVDCHTTNGSFHTEPITYAPSHLPFGDAGLLHFNQFVMLPQVAEATRNRTGYAAIPYGNFKDAMQPEQGWVTYDHRPRYLSNYVSLRNQLSILVEMYAYAEFEVRVKACQAFLQSILEFTDQHGAEMRALKRQAESAVVAAAAPGGVPIRFHTEYTTTACEEPLTIQGYRMELRKDHRGRERAFPINDETVDYRVPYFGIFEMQGEGAPLPEAYLFPRGLIEIRDKLVQHGIEVEEFAGPLTAEVSLFEIEKIETSEHLFQGHYLQQLVGRWETRSESFPAGVFRVSTRQPLARLAAYLLEPESDDGLVTWNFMGRYLLKGQWTSEPGTYPIVKWHSR